MTAQSSDAMQYSFESLGWTILRLNHCKVVLYFWTSSTLFCMKSTNLFAWSHKENRSHQGWVPSTASYPFCIHQYIIALNSLPKWSNLKTYTNTSRWMYLHSEKGASQPCRWKCQVELQQGCSWSSFFEWGAAGTKIDSWKSMGVGSEGLLEDEIIKELTFLAHEKGFLLSSLVLPP